MKAKELVDKAVAVYRDRASWTYVQGAIGDLGQSNRVRSLYTYFYGLPTKSASMTLPYGEWLSKYGYNKKCTDCNNFVNYLLGYDISMYSVNGYRNMPAYAGTIETAPAGCVLTTNGHVGLSIGNGQFIDFYAYNQTCRLGNIKGSLFDKAGYIKGIDYSKEENTMLWNKVIQEAYRLFEARDNITYCLGCTGEVVGRDKIVENQFKYYYQTNEWQDKIGASINGWVKGISVDDAWLMWSTQYAGKMAFDCSGFIDFCIGYPGSHKYSSWNFGDMPKNKSIAEGVACSVLWKKGHVALDVGYGGLLEIGAYGKTIEYHKNTSRDFTSSHLITGVDYTGADAR